MNASVETIFKGVEDLNPRVPIADLVTTARFEAERDKIFRRSWLHVAHERELPEPGSYVVKDVPPLAVSLLIMRGQDGTVRGFHNVCTHRGNKIAPSGSSGCKKVLACGFHGWSFTCEGKLHSVTDEKQFKALDKSLLDLKPVNLETWEGHVFVNFEAKPRETLKQWLGQLYGEYGGYFEQHEVLNARVIHVKCNWNLAINAFLEGYHTLYLHGKSVPDYQGGPTNPERHRPFMEMFARHMRYSAPSNPHHQWTPAEEIAWRYGRQCLPAFDNDMTGMPVGVNPGKAQRWAFDVMELFPNIFWLLGNHFHVEAVFWPIDADNTLIIGANYGYKSKTPAERLSQEFAQSRGRIVLREDLSTLEAQHAALKSGVLTHFQLSQQEIAVQHHFRVATDMLESRS